MHRPYQPPWRPPALLSRWAPIRSPPVTRHSARLQSLGQPSGRLNWRRATAGLTLQGGCVPEVPARALFGSGVGLLAWRGKQVTAGTPGRPAPSGSLGNDVRNFLTSWSSRTPEYPPDSSPRAKMSEVS